jgi:hypothetical protein
MDRENSMRAISLVLLSIAIMALLLTDADAKRRSSAQGSQAVGASRSWCATYGRKGISDNCSYATDAPRCGLKNGGSLSASPRTRTIQAISEKTCKLCRWDGHF